MSRVHKFVFLRFHFHFEPPFSDGTLGLFASDEYGPVEGIHRVEGNFEYLAYLVRFIPSRPYWIIEGRIRSDAKYGWHVFEVYPEDEIEDVPDFHVIEPWPESEAKA